MSKEISEAWDTLQSKMSSNFDWAWSVHCNIAMPILDHSSLTHIEANIAAASVMQSLFNYDVTGLQRYVDIVDPVKSDSLDEDAAMLKSHHSIRDDFNRLNKKAWYDYRKRLKAILLKKSYRSGTFTLTSGKTSDFYIDVKQTSLSAEGAFLCGRLMLDMMIDYTLGSGIDIKAVGGMTLGADPLVTAVSLASFTDASGIPAFIVRKESKGHDTNNYIEGLSNLNHGDYVALVEDVVTTGGTLLKVIERVEAQGFKVVMVMTVVDRQEGGAETLAKAGYELHSIFTKAQLLNDDLLEKQIDELITTSHVCQCRTTEPFVDDIGDIDRNFKILAINPVNKKVYTEKDSMIANVYDLGLIPLLNKYMYECGELCTDVNHIASIDKMIKRVSLYQQNRQSAISNSIAYGKSSAIIDHTEVVIDRKFVIMATDRSGNIYNERSVILFCAKDRALIPALVEYRKFHEGNRLDQRSLESIDELIQRIHRYQKHIECRIPDTIGGEISRCLDGVGLNNN